MKNSLLKKIKFYLFKFFLIRKIIIKRHFSLHKKRLKLIEKYASKLGINFYSPKDFYSVDINKYNSCHIWGSGSTANQTRQIIKNKKDIFNIGFNLSAILDLKFNFYFIENAQQNNQQLIDIQKQLIENILVPSKCVVLMKNIWQEKNNFELALETFNNHVRFIRDLTIPHYGNSDIIINECTKKLFEKDDNYFRQSCTTVITAIIFAYNLGFKKIVLHGVDFGGGYFYDDVSENYDKKYIPKKRWSYESEEFNKKWRRNDSHPTSGCLIPFIKNISNLLNEKGVDLYCSTHKSPLSQYLRVDPKLI